VRPLALYPLGLLLLILFYQLWSKRITLPWNRPLTILLAFTLMALISTAFGALLAPIELRGHSYFDRAIRAWITLIIGLAFFLAAVWMNRNEADIKFSLKWLLAGMVLHMLWGAVQAVGLRIGLRGQLNEIQRLFSVRGLVKNKRVSGFAYEPSWLAGQLATLYLPWLVASLIARYRLSRFKWLEVILFLGGLVTLIDLFAWRIGGRCRCGHCYFCCGRFRGDERSLGVVSGGIPFEGNQKPVGQDSGGGESDRCKSHPIGCFGWGGSLFTG